MSREKILALDDTTIEKTINTAWGDDLYLRVMNGLDRRKLSQATKDFEIDVQYAVHVVCLCLCDKDGKPIFNYPDDVELLETKNSKVLIELFAQATALNKITVDAIQATSKN